MSDSGLHAILIAERATLLRLLSARLGSREEAEDALQDLWLKLEDATPGPIAQPAAYIYRMANNLALDRRRATMRRGQREAGWHEVLPTAEEQPDAERTLIARERLAHVEGAIAAMPERVSMAFRLYRFEGLQQRAVADRMGVSVSAVEKLLQRAYRKIHDAGREGGVETSAPRRQGLQED